MARILMAWELGQNFGHVLPLLPVSKRLRAMGHEVVFALKDLRQVGPRVAAEGFRVFQAPAHAGQTAGPGDPPPESMVDVLRRFGYADPAVLSTYCGAWTTLLQLLGTDLLVASYAPTALLAARTLHLQACLVGMPFELPPPIFPSPPFRPLQDGDPQTLLRRERDLMGTVNQALRFAAPLEAAWEIFLADRQVLWTFPQLDPSAGSRRLPSGADVEYAGAIFDPSVGPDVQWPSSSGPRFFGYLRLGEARLHELVSALREVDAAFSLVVPSVDGGSLPTIDLPNVRVSRQPIRLESALASAHAVISYGSHGTICASLLAGKPLVLVPATMADVSLSRHVARLGAAVLADARDCRSIASACRAVIADSRFREASVRFQSHYSNFDVSLQSDRLAAVLDGMSSREDQPLVGRG